MCNLFDSKIRNNIKLNKNVERLIEIEYYKLL